MSGLTKYFIFVVFAVIAVKILDFIFGGDSLSTGFIVLIVGAAVVYALDKTGVNQDEDELLGYKGGSLFETIGLFMPSILKFLLELFLVIGIAAMLIVLDVGVIWSFLIAIYLVYAGFKIKEKGFHKFLKEDTGIGDVKKITWQRWLILSSLLLILGIFIYLNYTGAF